MDEDEFEDFLAENNSDGFSQKLDEDLDYALALSLQSTYNGEENSTNTSIGYQNKSTALVEATQNASKQSPKPISIVDETWEVLDPIPNIHNLFLQFNADYFWNALATVEVRWSSRMTLCAGVCCYEGSGGLCSVRLSQPLLKYRPRRDLVETLLHEMIHAYLFVTHNNKDHDAHGPEFLKHMNRINQKTGTKISVYHSFHNEVDIHRKHWWKCDGPCQHRKPFYGLVKRAMNRAPAPKDPWWADHQAKCGGTFRKIKEPENYGKKKTAKKVASGDNKKLLGDKDIRNFFSPPSIKNANVHTITSSPNVQALKEPVSNMPTNVHTISHSQNSQRSFIPFSGKGFTLGNSQTNSNKSKLVHPVSRENNLSKRNGTSKIHNTGMLVDSHTSGSRKIVFNFNYPPLKPTISKSETQEKTKNVSFTGHGHASNEISFSSVNSELLPFPTPPNKKQKTLETFFTNSSTKLKSVSKKTVVLFDSESDDDGIEVLPGNSDNRTDSTNAKVQCPVCGETVNTEIINSHLDTCLKDS